MTGAVLWYLNRATGITSLVLMTLTVVLGTLVRRHGRIPGLPRFAVQGLKIDRSFIDGLGQSREDTAIVTATLAFASALGLVVTAEGVETAAQLQQLRALGCQQAQGYLLARPVPASAVPQLLEEAAALAMLSRAG